MIVLFFISGICAIYIYGVVTWCVCAFWIAYLIITVIMTYRNTADVKDNLYDALDRARRIHAGLRFSDKKCRAEREHDGIKTAAVHGGV